MPAIIVNTSMKCSDEQKKNLAAHLSKTCAETMGKPEQYVMVVVHDGLTILLGGEIKNAAWVQLRSIGGLSKDMNLKMSQKICACIQNVINVEPNATYINFIDIQRENWGWDNKTF